VALASAVEAARRAASLAFCFRGRVGFGIVPAVEYLFREKSSRFVGQYIFFPSRDAKCGGGGLRLVGGSGDGEVIFNDTPKLPKNLDDHRLVLSREEGLNTELIPSKSLYSSLLVRISTASHHSSLTGTSSLQLRQPATASSAVSRYLEFSMASQIVREPFPARTKVASATINGINTNASSVAFADKIVLTISQNGRLAHWVRVTYLVRIFPLRLY
jgi:hypothetical protein